MELLYGKNSEQLDLAAFAATFYRLAGDEDNYERLLEMDRRSGVETTAEGFKPPEEIKAARSPTSGSSAKRCLINEQVERALPLLRVTTSGPGAHAPVAAAPARGSIALLNIEADTVLDRDWFTGLPAARRRPRCAHQRAGRHSQPARQLRELGRHEQLDQLMETLQRLASWTTPRRATGQRWRWSGNSVGYDEAFASAHQASLARQTPAVVFGTLLKQQGPLAAAWYEYLSRSDPSGDRQKQIATSVWLVVAQPPPGKLPDAWRTIVADAAAAGEAWSPPSGPSG
jgi:hypothetical protein